MIKLLTVAAFAVLALASAFFSGHWEILMALPLVGMAYEIPAFVNGAGWPVAFMPGNHKELADQTASNSYTALVAAARMGRAVIYQKAWTSGTGTVGPIYELQVADDSLGTNVTTIAIAQLSRADEQCAILEGVVPTTLKTYYRIKLTLSGTDTATFDACVDLA